MNRRVLFLAAILLIAGLMFALGPGSDAPACPDCNIVVISVDPLPAGHVGAYGYDRNTTPTIDRLAAESYVFNRTFTTSGHTLPALYSTFTSTYVSQHGVIPRDPEPATRLAMLPEVLDEAGYTTLTYNGGANVGAPFGFDRGFDAFRSVTVNRSEVATGRFKYEDTMAFLDDQPREEPYFLFYQTFYPHDPYFTTEPYRSMFAPYDAARDARSRERWLEMAAENRSEEGFYDAYRRYYYENASDDPAVRDHLVARYDGTVRRVDTFLDRFLTRLEAAGDLEDTIIVVTSQHGEQFFQHGDRGHGTSLYNEVMRVPLIVHVPGQESRTTIDRFTSLVDLAPTLVDMVGARGAAERTGFADQAMGTSLHPAMQGRDPGKRFVLAEAFGEYAFIDVPSRIKYYAGDDGDLFFDLSSDMSEQQPLPVSAETARVADRADRIRDGLIRENVTTGPAWPYFGSTD